MGDQIVRKATDPCIHADMVYHKVFLVELEEVAEQDHLSTVVK